MRNYVLQVCWPIKNAAKKITVMPVVDAALEAADKRLT
jgi:hypothetical protein